MSRATSSSSGNSRTTSQTCLEPITKGAEQGNAKVNFDVSPSRDFRTSSQGEAFPTYDEPGINALLAFDAQLTQTRERELAEAVGKALLIDDVEVSRKEKSESPPLPPPPPPAPNTAPTDSNRSPAPPPSITDTGTTPLSNPELQRLQTEFTTLRTSTHTLHARLDLLTTHLQAKQDSEKGLLALMRGQTQSLEEIFARLEGRGVGLKRSRSEGDMCDGKPLWGVEKVWRGRRVANWALEPAVEVRGARSGEW